MDHPPIKPPRGVKPIKETSGLLMSVIRTLSASETNEQRDREKAKLDTEYKQSDRKLDELVSKHEQDLTQVIQVFGALSQQVCESREKIHKVKENLKACKTLLHCKRDELKKLWMEGLEYKYMLQLLEEVEKINEVPNRLSSHLIKKQYLHATQLLVEAVSLGKGSLEGVEGLKELSQELEFKKEHLHVQLVNELKQHLYLKTAQHALVLRRQGSGRELLLNSPLQRSMELRASARQRSSVKRNILEFASQKLGSKIDDFDIKEDLETADPEADSSHFMAVLVKCLALLDKLPFTVNMLKGEIQSELLNIIQCTTHYISDINTIQIANDTKHAKQIALPEFMQTLFEQFRQVAQAHTILLSHLLRACEAYKVNVRLYDMKTFWSQVQAVLQLLLTDYLDIQNISSEPQLLDNLGNHSDISSYFSRRKQPVKKKLLFKFDGSTSALTMNMANGVSQSKSSKEKVLVCSPDPNNITLIFVPLMYFIEEIEQSLDLNQGVSCSLNQFLTNYVTEGFLMRKKAETLAQIDMAIRAADAWKGTILLDVTTDYKPLLVSTVTVENCIREWQNLLQALPLYGEQIVKLVCTVLKEYKDICFAAYHGIVQPHSEDRRICSAAWLKDEDISRFLKSLPNWLNLKAQQEYQAHNERRKTNIKREHTLEEESLEDIRQRNRREAEILASNLGEGGVTSGEILSDMTLLKELAQLQESMEWFSVQMLQFASEFRQEPLLSLSPAVVATSATIEMPLPISPSTLHQLTSIAQDFDELANTCLLLLHLEVRVQCFHYLLAQSEYNKETHEPDPKVLELSRVLANVDEAMTSSLHPRKCKYIFEGLGHLIAKILISSSQYMKYIDEAGIQRMCRNVFALQQTLTNITMTREVALDHARHYFELFFLTPEEILNSIVENGPEFSELEYMNAFQLLHRSKGNKSVGAVNTYLERLSDILGEVGVTV